MHVLNFPSFFCFFFLYALILLFLFHDCPTLSDSSSHELSILLSLFSLLLSLQFVEHAVIITTLVVTLQGEPKMKSNKIYEPKMQTTKKITNQGEDDCSMLGLEPRHRRRNRKTELVPNPQSSNRPVCDFNVQISIFVLMEDRQDVSFYIYIYIYIYLCACFYFACMCFLCCFAVWWMRKLGKANLKLVC